MFRKSLNYFKIAARTIARSADIFVKPVITIVRETPLLVGENLLELNSQAGAKFAIGDLAAFGREVNQVSPLVARKASQKTKAYSQVLAKSIVNTAKTIGQKAGILTHNESVKECIIDYLMQNLAEYVVSLHIKNDNKSGVTNYGDIKHVPCSQHCMVSALLTPLVNRLLTLGVQNAHELAKNAYDALLECKENLAEQLYAADLDTFAYRLSAEEILAHCQNNTYPSAGMIEVKRERLLQQYHDSRKAEVKKEVSPMSYAVKPELEQTVKFSPF